MTLAEISDIGGHNLGVNSTIFIELHSAKVVIDMMWILCQRIITGQEVVQYQEINLHQTQLQTK